MAPQEEEMIEYRRIIKNDVIDSAIEEIGVGVNICNMTSNYELEASSFFNILQW